ncbi:alpha/beta hydrolase [Phyllobacterium meliloti]|uniref:alpha/beta hydrolase n=1 Tax=Phyllobacterium meliloti TaxID=555317 RepID=UPI001D132759|nr:alpha/beta hydrolase [Phyllobacterium sp. T1293]UGX86669.1 alpha/beta hydrolase [Phyllobacterium sp. T1293]
MSFADIETIRSSTGAALAMRFSPAEGSGKAIVQISHGVAEHCLRYQRFAEHLNAQGFHVYAHDHRGHGYTKAEGAPLGRFAQNDGMRLVLKDMDVINAIARVRHPGLPLILFGHSMGGLVGLNYVIEYQEKVQAAAIWNANFSVGLSGRLAQGILRAERMFLGSDVPSMLLPKLTFQTWARGIKDARTPFDWLSRDPKEVDAYVTDPLCGWDASVSMWRDVFGFTFGGADNTALAKIRRVLPFNLAGGGQDPATAKGSAVRDLANRMQKLGFSDVTSKVYEDTRHEGLNEINRDVIMADFTQWAVRVVQKQAVNLERT